MRTPLLACMIAGLVGAGISGTAPRAWARSHAAEQAPWLQAEPLDLGGRARSKNPPQGYFKAADGTFEFVPPRGFALLDEGVQRDELRTLFGPRNAQGEPPTLLIVWHESPVGAAGAAIAHEAASYHGRSIKETWCGEPSLRIEQHEGTWRGTTRVFVKYGRLYTVTFSGQSGRLDSWRSAVERSCKTFRFFR